MQKDLSGLRWSDETATFEGEETEDLDNEDAWIEAHRPVNLPASR